MRPISSWGLLSAEPHQTVNLRETSQIPTAIAKSTLPGLPYGMGRSYGDACLNPQGTLWMTKTLDHLITFDEKTGYLTCEAGVLLKDIQDTFLPRGWMLPVTPGTQLVTVGGAIANDVHGKNHHKHGSFGDHIRHIKLVRTDGHIVECSPTLRHEWFAATVGGLGLTGIIAEAGIQLHRTNGPWLETETIPYSTLDEFFQLADDSEAGWEHTVSWVDCLSGSSGRGIFTRGRPYTTMTRSTPAPRTLVMPFTPPFSLVNRLSLQLFNSAYYYLRKQKAGLGIVHYSPFLYPLDYLQNWNRIYGRKGFFQYQSVVPRHTGKEAVQAMLKEISRAGDGSFLAVLKTFGDRQPAGMLSFPQNGVTLALDFPNHGKRTQNLFIKLDAIVRECGGRIYPAKDARMPRELFEAGYPRLNEFLPYRDQGISSGLSRRLMGS